MKLGPAFQGRTAESLAREAERAFVDRFGRSAAWLAVAPGRVNLIGDHTDYNDGFVLPLAIDRHVAIAAAPAAAGSPALRLYSAALDAAVDVNAGAPPRGPAPWWSYVQGVLAGFRERGIVPPALDALVLSDIPLGAGLSSSAALEVATATLFESATERTLARIDKARLCQKAEHEYAGVPCGLMDQLASVFGDDRRALLIDCRSVEVRAVPLSDAFSVLVCNTNVRHSLGDGGYARRRAECDEAARILGVRSLRDVTAEGPAEGRDPLPTLLARRVRHVVSENARTLAAAAALERGDIRTVGRLLFESHASLRDDYEVSCPELDAVVDAARDFDEAIVAGARMTGGGFGGCALALVRNDRLVEVARGLEQRFEERTRGKLDTFVARAARGARPMAIHRATTPGL